MTEEMIQKLVKIAKDESGVYFDGADDNFIKYAHDGYEWVKDFNDGDDWDFDEYSLTFTLISQRMRYQHHNSLDIFENNFEPLVNKLILNIALAKEVTK